MSHAINVSFLVIRNDRQRDKRCSFIGSIENKIVIKQHREADRLRLIEASTAGRQRENRVDS